jgi:hypothetical protein
MDNRLGSKINDYALISKLALRDHLKRIQWLHLWIFVNSFSCLEFLGILSSHLVVSPQRRLRVALPGHNYVGALYEIHLQINYSRYSST